VFAKCIKFLGGLHWTPSGNKTCQSEHKTMETLSLRLGLTNCLIITNGRTFLSTAIQDRWKSVVNIHGKLCL